MNVAGPPHPFGAPAGPRVSDQPLVSRDASRSVQMPLIAMLHLLVASCTRWRLQASPAPLGLLASRAFWLGGLASAALWALALEIAFG